MKELVTAFLALPALVLLILSGVPVESGSPRGVRSTSTLVPLLQNCHAWLVIPRGGSDEEEAFDDESEKLEEEEDNEVEDEEEIDNEYVDEEEEDVVMVKATVEATEKVKAKKASATKKTVSAKMTKKKGPSRLKRYVPYIVRACLTPATLFAMTMAYFASLFNLNYLTEDLSQDLRSALEEKAKKSGSSGGGRKGKRAMKRGQAKTLSDLPQLST